MNKLTKLKILILSQGLTQRELARRAGVNESILSMILTGKYNPGPIQRAQLAAALQKPETEVFQDLDIC